MTPFTRRCEILGNLWLHHRETKDLAPLLDNHDLGLSLSFSVWSKLVAVTPGAESVINQAWDALVQLIEAEAQTSHLLSDIRLAIVLSKEPLEANA